MADNQLHQLPQQEIKILNELNVLSLAKKTALLDDNLESLEAIVLKEEALAINLQKLENACSPQVRFF